MGRQISLNLAEAGVVEVVASVLVQALFAAWVLPALALAVAALVQVQAVVELAVAVEADSEVEVEVGAEAEAPAADFASVAHARTGTDRQRLWEPHAVAGEAEEGAVPGLEKGRLEAVEYTKTNLLPRIPHLACHSLQSYCLRDFVEPKARSDGGLGEMLQRQHRPPRWPTGTTTSFPGY